VSKNSTGASFINLNRDSFFSNLMYKKQTWASILDLVDEKALCMPFLPFTIILQKLAT
jgi:hypothetical protein